MHPLLNISCLHPAKSDIAAFEAARRALGLDDVMLKHRVRSDLAAAAEEAGGPSLAMIKHTAAELMSLARGADGLLLTAPAMGSATRAAAMLGVPIVQADLALAEAAVREGGRVTALCATGAALSQVRALFETAAFATGATIEVRLVSGAADLLAAGREADYLQAIAEAADHAFEDGAATVALAHTSMAGAAGLVRTRQPLSGPAAGLAAIVAAVNTMAAQSP